MTYTQLSTEIISNLQSYINPADYEIIISDTELKSELKNEKWKEIWYENIQWKDIREAVSYYFSEYSTIMLILAHHTIDAIVPFLVKLPKETKLTILDLHSGGFARGEKSIPSQYSPYSLAEYGFEVYSPIDEKNLKNLIQQANTHAKTKWSKYYLAIPDIVLPEELTKDEELPVIINYDTEKKAQTGILAIGYPYIQVGQLLEQQQLKTIQLLISDTIILNPKACSHIAEMQQLIIVVDSQHPEIIKKSIQAQLYQAKLSDIDLTVITPKYENLSTVLKDYQLQETEFDAEGLAKQLNLG